MSVVARLSAAILVSFTVISCGAVHSDSRLKIDSGEILGKDAENSADGVFQTITSTRGASSGNSCTGTAVSTSTALTAGHCVYQAGESIGSDGKVRNKKYCITNSIYKNLCSSEIYVNPKYPSDASTSSRGFDSAYVVFPEGTFKTFFNMTTRFVAVGDSVLMVGYSRHNLPNPSEGTKRFGYNKVASLVAGARDDITTHYDGSFDGVGVSPGDSGGPMMRKCEVVGIASRMGEGGSKKIGLHTNTTQSTNADFFKSTKSGYFCGISGDDPTQCPSSSLFRYSGNLWGKSKEFPCAVGTVPGQNPNEPFPEPQTLAIYAALSESDELSIRGVTELSNVFICTGETKDVAMACSTKLTTRSDGPDFKVQLSMPKSSEFFVKITATQSSDKKTASRIVAFKRR